MRPSDSPAWHAIHGWLSPDEADLLYLLAADLSSAAQVVEIGTYRGRGTAALALGCMVSGAHLTSIDHYQGVMGAAADWESSPDRVRATLAALGITGVTLLAAESTQVAATWTQPIALLFVDGSHDLASVASDIAAWWPHLQPHRVCCFHDYVAGHGDGVIAAVRTLCARGQGLLRDRVGMTAVVQKLRR